MIEQNVQVVRCQGDRLWVRMGSQSGCTACDNGNGCGAGVFAKLLRGKAVVIELARNDLSVEPGQMLTLAFEEQVYIKLVLASYGWPLLAALAGAYAGHGLSTWLEFGPLLVDAGALSAGLLFGGIALRLIKNRRNADAVLNSLHMTACYPSATPNMCSRNPAES
jgi:sigma-E factor negative regulatory protein RseC